MNAIYPVLGTRYALIVDRRSLTVDRSLLEE